MRAVAAEPRGDAPAPAPENGDFCTPPLHPALGEVLRQEGWTSLTEAQRAALPPLRAGRHTLLVAPTGHGKTEAAMVPVLDRLLVERDRRAGKGWPLGFKALYVTPLRALNRDLLGRLEGWGQRLGLEVGVRHGDTSQAERARQARRPPDVLITTPETLQLLLYGDTLRRHLGTVRFVVLDEVHELAASERGAQLAVALERVEEVVAQDEALRTARARERVCPDAPDAPPQGSFQRIGLSATVADPEAVARFFGGGRDVAIVRVQAAKETRLRVLAPEATAQDEVTGARLALPPDAVAEMREVRALVEGHARTIVFHNTRDGAELLASRSRLLDEEAGRPPLLELHHGSLSQEHRQDVERRFKHGPEAEGESPVRDGEGPGATAGGARGETPGATADDGPGQRSAPAEAHALRGLVATSSLELGIDVGAIDHVVQVHSPRSVSRLVQRLGRAGHRVGAVSEGTLLAGGAEDVLECLAVARRATEHRLEPLRMRPLPLVVLANQVIALANEYDDLSRDWAHAVISRAAPFEDLDDLLFEAVWEALQQAGTLFAAERAQRVARGGRARRHFLDHISLIADERKYRVVDEATKRSVGTVDEAFVAAGLEPGAPLVMAGRGWRVLEVENEEGRVRVAPLKDLGAVPQWSGGRLPVSYEVAQEVARLRGLVARQDEEREAYPGDAAAWDRAAAPVREQVRQGLEVPTDTTVTLETGRRRITINVALGTRGNEALGRITAALLHQRLGAPVGLDHDAYRIHLEPPVRLDPQDVVDLWRTLDPDTLDLLLARVLQDSPLVRHHLVHVAKHFGALPKRLDPTRTTRRMLDELLADPAMQEETLSRLAHERLDLEAVAAFLRALDAGAVRTVIQALGPLSRLGQDESRRLMAPPRSDTKLLEEVRRRIEHSDVLMACTNCGNAWPAVVADLPRKVHCRRCQTIQVACLRPWHEDQLPLLRKNAAALTQEEREQRQRILRNAGVVSGFGPIACRCLVARGVGPDTAARILQKVADPESPHFWREILQAELIFAQTHAYWAR